MMSSLMAMLGLDASPFKRALLEAQADARYAGREINESFGEFIGEKIGAFGAAVFSEEAIRQTVEYSEKIEMLSNRLGISTEAVQRWDYALKQNGSSMDSAAGFFERLLTNEQKALQGNEAMIQHFQALGISLDDLKNKRIEDIAFKVGTTVGEGDVQKLMADLRAVGGRGAGEMVAAFKNEFSTKMAEAPVASEEALAELQAAGEQFKSYWANIRAFLVEVLATISRSIGTTMQAVAAGGVSLFDGVKKTWQTWSEPEGWIHVASFHKLFDGLKAGAKEAAETMNNWLEGVGLKEKERAGRKDDMLNHPIGSGDDPALSATATSEIKKLKEEAAKITRESAIAEVSGVERVKALLLEIGRIKSEISNEKDPVEQARLGVELARTEAEKARTEQSNAKEIIRLKEQAARLSMNTALSEMGAAERVEAITKGIAGLKEDMAKAADEKTKAEIALEIEKQNAELARARKEEEKADRSEARGNRYQAPEVNALQRIGAYVSPEAAQMKSTAERSEQHLQAIRHGIDELQRNQRKTQF